MQTYDSDLIDALSDDLLARYPDLVRPIPHQWDRKTALVLQRNGANVLVIRWDSGAQAWRLTDKLRDARMDGCLVSLEDLVAQVRQRHLTARPEPEPRAELTSEDEEALAAFGAELFRHNAGLRNGVERVVLTRDALRVYGPGGESAVNVEVQADGSWSVFVVGHGWEPFDTLDEAIQHVRDTTGLVVDQASELCPLAQQVQAVCGELVALIDRKNRAYGNSATEPLRVFSRASTVEQLAVRIDDKLSRLARGTRTEDVPEDTVIDLIGYLVIYLTQTRKETK